ncbi:MAG: COR domain-containing protein [Cyanobacteria bacterium P01_D01_bin.50]
MTDEELLETIEQAATDGLTELDLSGVKLTVLPAEIGKLTQLKKLILGKDEYDEDGVYINTIGNKLRELPKEIGLLNQLEELHIAKNQLSSLPAEIGQLTNLQSLNLSQNKLSSLPAEIGQLTNLKTLDLLSNELSSLPAEIGQFTNLQSLKLSHNKLSSLPAEIGQLSSLQSLNLSWNQLSSLPAEIGQLSSLQSLDLSWNQLSSLPAEIGQLSSLQSLDLYENKLSSLPAEIGQFTNLQSLNLSWNKLSSLPAEIGQLSSLQSLSLSRNQLSSLPGEIGQLSSLQSLKLYNNQLSSLPAEFGQLTNLQSLYLWGNQLSSLPETIKKLTKLKKLDLRRNPLPIPPEILGAKNIDEDPGDVNEILDFYFRVQDPNETEPLYEAKLLIVGEGGAGKTSLAKKIEDENYQLKSDEESTEGIDVIQWKFPLADDNEKEFRVNIWDFGGQEIYHSTHQFFLSKRSLYVLVADNRRENTDFYWWLKVVELLSDNSPVLIVKNEKQNRQCEINISQLRGEFTNLKEVLPTNLATNRGLAEIKQEIKNQIAKLEHVGIPLPTIWVRVRAALDNDSRNYISREEYYRLCEINKFSDRQDMLRLSRYLHDLGVCLHFQDDSTLKHCVILKPEWATTAVYKVLDNEALRNNLGHFTKDELADIWKDSEYRDMRDELLQLMMRFKLCYEIPHKPGNYIAPQLLEIEAPLRGEGVEGEKKYYWNKSNNLILRYKYEFMPKGIMTRFIVETHDLIEEQKLVWRSGVILNQYGTRAEVIENYNQREITVRVCGSEKKGLLEIVNREFEKIHLTFERLQYQILVPCNCNECTVSDNPYSYYLEDLRKRLTKGRFQIECGKSYEMVDVKKLIDDVNFSPQQENGESKHPNVPSKPESPKSRGEKLRELHNAITSAYPEKTNLEMMLFYELNQNLDAIATGDNMKAVVFKLIQWAESQGRLKELVEAALEYNPGNIELQRISKYFLN